MITINSIKYNNTSHLTQKYTYGSKDFSYYQMSKTSKNMFLSTFEYIDLGTSIINVGIHYSRMLAKATLPKDKITFMSVLKTKDNRGLCKAQKVKENMIFCLNECTSLSFVFTPGTIWTAFQISIKELEKLNFDINKFTNTYIKNTDKSAKEASLRIKKIIKYLHNSSKKDLLEVDEKALHKNLLHAFIKSFINAKDIDDLEKNAYKNIAIQTYNYIRDNSDYPITMRDLSKVIKTSERTIQRAFKLYYDTTLQNFIKIHRLHKVHKKLLTNPKKITITEIAFKHGFTHLSRFAQNYKELFQELPSETYRKSHSKLIIRKNNTIIKSD